MSGRSRSLTRKKTSPVKQPTRDRSSSRGRPRKDITAVEEKKSPARKSPSRKSPSRKSPSRKILADSPSKTKKMVEKMKQTIEDIRNSVSPSKLGFEEVVRNSVSRIEDLTNDVITVRKSSRLIKKAEVLEKDVVGTKNHENNISKPPADSAGLHREFGNWFVVLLLMIVTPVAILAAQLACTKDNCGMVPRRIPLSLRRFFDIEGSLWYLGFFFFQVLLSSIPLGPVSEGIAARDSYVYRNNGPMTFILTAAVLYGLKYYWNFPLTRILDKGVSILTTSVLLSLVLSIGIYVYSRRAGARRNPYARTNNVIYDFWVGREVNPIVGPIDIKTTLMRISTVSVIIYNALVILKEVQGKSAEQWSILVLLICVQQIIFALDCLIFESCFLSSFVVNQEGTGFMLVLTFALAPFIVTLIPKYLFLSSTTYNLWVAIGCSVVFLAGLIINRVSTLQKSKFKRNPSSGRPADIYPGKKFESSLLKAGLWGVVRHPNYLGVFIIYVSWVALALLSAPLHWIPIACLLFVTAQIVFYTLRVESRSKVRHLSTWNSYVASTKSRIIPYVF